MVEGQFVPVAVARMRRDAETAHVVEGVKRDDEVAAEIPAGDGPVERPLIQRERVNEEIPDSYEILARVIWLEDGPHCYLTINATYAPKRFC